MYIRKFQKQSQLPITMWSLKGMPPLEDAEPLEGAIAPDPGTNEPAGNKFTRLHSPRTEEADSDDPPASSQETSDCSQQDSKKQFEEDHPPTPNICSGSPDLIMAQLDQEQCESDEAQAQWDAPSIADPAKVESTDIMVDLLQVLLTSVPVALGSTTVTKEDWLLGVGDVTTTNVVARLPPDQVKGPSGNATPNEKDDVKLTFEHMGDNMEDV